MLEQYQDLFDGQPPQTALASLLQQARELRTDPNAVLALARERGFPGVEQAVTLQQELAEAKQRESKRALEDFMRGKEYFSDVNFQTALAAEMRELQKDAPGLKGQALLKLAHDNLVERTGLGKQREQKREAEQQQRQAQRDAEWKQLITKREAELLKQQQERDARQREAIEHTRAAKKAASVNVKGSPGHGSNPRSMRDTLRETWDRLNG